MRLERIEPQDLGTVVAWMAQEENYKWLDFGAGQQRLTAAALGIMSKRDIHCLRLFTSDENHRPIGIVALSNIASEFGSATLWYVLGDKSQAGKGYTSRAVGAMLRHAFGELGLESVNAWAVAANEASRRVLEKNGFRPIGRQRCCHRIDGELRDRFLYDILAKEHRD